MSDGTRVPMEPGEANALMEQIDAGNKKLKEDFPTEVDAIREMFRAYSRLKDFGWRDAIYCPKDGSQFDAIEAGSTGIHRCHYDGVWPDGYWWISSNNNLWPSRPILFRLDPKAEAERKAKTKAAIEQYKKENPE